MQCSSQVPKRHSCLSASPLGHTRRMFPAQTTFIVSDCDPRLFCTPVHEGHVKDTEGIISKGCQDVRKKQNEGLGVGCLSSHLSCSWFTVVIAQQLLLTQLSTTGWLSKKVYICLMAIICTLNPNSQGSTKHLHSKRKKGDIQEP